MRSKSTRSVKAKTPSAAGFPPQRSSVGVELLKLDESLPFSYSEQHRRECEARWVLKLPLAKRREYLESLEKPRGKAGREYLEAEIRKQWEAKRLQQSAAKQAQAEPSRLPESTKQVAPERRPNPVR